METIDALQWLKKKELFPLCEKSAAYLKKIFVPCLGIQNEKILIIGDVGEDNKDISAILSGAYYMAAQKMNLSTKLVLQQVKNRGAIADEDVVRSIASLEKGSVIFINLSNTLGSIKELGKSFRALTRKMGYRFVSTPSLGDLTRDKLDCIIKAIDIDYRILQAKHRKIKEQLDSAKEIHLTTPAGTDLHINIEGSEAICADGNYAEPGQGGNMPAGEVYIPPNGKKVNGTFVIDGASRNRTHTALIKTPIKLEIQEGSITDIQGSEEADQLKETIEWAATISKHPSSVKRIGEFGIGLNPNASIIGATINDEKVLGTAHIGIGSNYWFGGSIYAKVHLDQVCRNPTIKLDGKKLEY